MSELQMGIVESKFADIIWRTAPVTSSQLVKLGEAEMGWKRTTVHTVLRRQYVADSFHGSLPAFIAAFTQGRKLTEEERAEIRRMIDETEG